MAKFLFYSELIIHINRLIFSLFVLGRHIILVSWNFIFRFFSPKIKCIIKTIIFKY